MAITIIPSKIDFYRKLILSVFASFWTVQLLLETLFHILRDIRPITFEIVHPVHIGDP